MLRKAARAVLNLISSPEEKEEKEEEKIQQLYKSVQKVSNVPVDVSKDDLDSLSTAWQDPELPGLQNVVSSYQIDEFLEGRVDPVFARYMDALKVVADEAETLLDLACGGGYYSVIAEHAAPSLVYQGADFSDAMVEQARENFPGKEFEVQDATATTYEDQQFDVVSLSGALEHIPNYEGAIAELCRVARKFVLVHRLPLTEENEIKYTKAGQYNIVTPRIHFPLAYIEQQFAEYGFELKWQAAIYPANESIVSIAFARKN